MYILNKYLYSRRVNNFLSCTNQYYIGAEHTFPLYVSSDIDKLKAIVVGFSILAETKEDHDKLAEQGIQHYYITTIQVA